jgi:hypothetical protein
LPGDLEPLREWIEAPAYDTYFKPDVSLATPADEVPTARSALEQLGFVPTGERTRRNRVDVTGR